ncbi:MAG: PIN domain-containing protein [Microgenomates group bacterium]
MKYFLDTNIFLRFFIKENEKTFKETKKIIQLIKKGDIKTFTSHLVIAELDWTMRSYYKIPKNERLTFLDSILRLKNLALVDSFDLMATLSFYRNHRVKFIDCLFASNPLILTGKASIVSYDKDFDRLKIKRIEPRNF